MILLLVTILIFIGVFIALGFRPKNSKLEWKLRPIQLLSLLSFVLLFFELFIQIDANEVGIIYDPFKGGIQSNVYSEGFQSKSIFQEITKISTTNRTSKVLVYGQTVDSIYAEFEITVIYKIESKNAGSFFKVTGNSDIREDQLVSIAKEALQSITTKYDIYAILGEKLEIVREEFTIKLTSMMKERYHITIVSASFDDIDAGKEIEASIKRKAEAVQQVEIAEQEKKKSLVEAETARIKAVVEAEVALIKAEAQADAQIILNSVTVNAINKMYLGQFEEGEDTSTPETYGYLKIQEIVDIIFKQLYYDTWNGELPKVITDGSGIIIQP